MLLSIGVFCREMFWDIQVVDTLADTQAVSWVFVCSQEQPLFRTYLCGAGDSCNCKQKTFAAGILFYIYLGNDGYCTFYGVL